MLITYNQYAYSCIWAILLQTVQIQEKNFFEIFKCLRFFYGIFISIQLIPVSEFSETIFFKNPLRIHYLRFNKSNRFQFVFSSQILTSALQINIYMICLVINLKH